MPPRGLDHTAVPQLAEAIEVLLAILYSPEYYIPAPASDNGPKTERNEELCMLYTQGWSVPTLVAKFGISKARVYQILKRVGEMRGLYC